MKTLLKTTLILGLLITFAASAFAQFNPRLQYFRAQDQSGLNVFETPKQNNVAFEGLRVKIGGSNTLQFQGLSQDTDSNVDIFKLDNNFNLATSNLDIDVQLHNGLRMHLRTYLSSRHHAQPYVKGGYLQIDRLDFIQEDFLSELMDRVTIKVGHMQINYGDNHFRRSDNAQTIFNPFVGNFIMDSFTTEVGAEVYYQESGFIGMIGLTNGKLNQRSTLVTDPNQINTRVSLVGKLGYDSQVNEDLRVRLTGSVYHTGQSARTFLYAGDRAGSRYYNILTSNNGEFRIPRFDPAFNNELTAIMINPFVKFQGFEFYGVFENASGKSTAEPDTRTFNQYGAELLYRFGTDEKFYLGGRYNMVSGETAGASLADANDNFDVDITRFNIGGGWFLTPNVLTKVEYVKQTYDGFPTTSVFNGGEFSGFMIEAVISF
jgi:hypothetical protein